MGAIMSCKILVLAQGRVDPLIWGAILIGAIFLMRLLLRAARNFYRNSLKKDFNKSAFTIEKLEKMHQARQISDREFSQLRQGVLGLNSPNHKKMVSKSSSSVNDDD